MPNTFNTGDPTAYFLTWTSYGTRLPGDDRGWNRKGDEANLHPDPLGHDSAGSRLKEAPFQLAENDREVVEATIRKHCEIRKWILHALNIRSNHVHVVVSAANYDPETVASQFKAWCTRMLKAGEKKVSGAQLVF